MKTLLIFAIVLGSAIFAAGQSELPEYGSLADIAGRSKIYVNAEPDDRAAIIKELKKKKDFTIVNKADDAEFFIEYKMLSQNQVGPTNMNLARGRMDVYTRGDGKNKIAWSKTETNGAFKSAVAKALIKEFLRAIEKR